MQVIRIKNFSLAMSFFPDIPLLLSLKKDRVTVCIHTAHRCFSGKWDHGYVIHGMNEASTDFHVYHL